MGLETRNDNYDESRGEQIALNVDGDKGNRNAQSTYKSGLMDVQVGRLIPGLFNLFKI